MTYAIETLRSFWARLLAQELAPNLGVRWTDLYPILDHDKRIVRWYVKDRGFLHPGEPW